MRILINTINYAPEVTSTGKYIGEMGEWLAGRGHEVRVITAPPHYPEWKVRKGYSALAYRREDVGGADTWRCPTWVPARPTGLKRLLYLGSFAASSLPVTLAQARWRPDVVIVIAPPLFSAPAAWVSARLCGAETLLRVLDFEVDAAMDLGMLGKGGVRNFFYAVETFLMRGATETTTLTEPMRRRIINKGVPEARTWLSPDWSDLDLVRPMEPDDDIRREFGAGPGDILVMHAGNMGEKQGLEIALDAAEKLRGRAGIKFALVGGGAARERLESYAKERDLENARFFPVQPLERLPLMLAASDIQLVIQKKEAADLVMPSRLTNILAAGRPCVATADPDTALYEVLDEHGCGINTPPGDVEALVSNILELAGDEERRESLGRNARLYADSHLDKETLLSNFEGNLKRLAERSKVPRGARATGEKSESMAYHTEHMEKRPTPEEAIRAVMGRFPFEGYMNPASGGYMNVARTVERHLPPGGSILDFGCGPCDKTAVLQLLGYDCSGYDDLQDEWHTEENKRETILAFAAEFGIDFREPVGGEVPFEKNSFDMVMLHDVLEHLHDTPRHLLDHLMELLKPEGILFVTVPNAVNIRKRIDVLLGRTNLPPFDTYFWHDGPFRGHVREYVKDDLEQLAGYLDLETLELRGCDHMLEKLSPAARPAYLRTTKAFPGWKDSWALVARKKPGWSPRGADRGELARTLAASGGG